MSSMREYENCNHCDGRGYFEEGEYAEFTFVKLTAVCPHCCGLGWNTKGLDTEEDQVA
jgi:DnaJ-class molecular chaperone